MPFCLLSSKALAAICLPHRAVNAIGLMFPAAKAKHAILEETLLQLGIPYEHHSVAPTCVRLSLPLRKQFLRLTMCSASQPKNTKRYYAAAWSEARARQELHLI